MKESTREVGGSKMAIRYGNFLNKISSYYKRRSDKFISKGTKTIISNPACKFINPFTLIFTFTVDNTDKYQLVSQNDFRDKYIAWREKEDSYKERLLSYEQDMIEYNELDDKTEIDAPIAPTPLETSPISMNEMFMVILGRENAWFKKNS